MSRVYNELSAVVVTVEPLDGTGAAYLPTTARYRLDDCNTKQALVGWTTLTPATEMQISIPGSANDIKDTTLNKPEQKILTVNTDLDLATQQYSEYFYGVKNLSFAQES